MCMNGTCSIVCVALCLNNTCPIQVGGGGGIGSVFLLWLILSRCQYLHYIALNGSMTDELKKNSEGTSQA
jgi:hypothetical protein